MAEFEGGDVPEGGNASDTPIQLSQKELDEFRALTKIAAEISPEERHLLLKMRVYKEVQDDVVAWVKKTGSFYALIFTVLITLVGVFGVGGYITQTVGDKIDKEMVVVDKRVFDAVISTVKVENSAKEATKYAESERERLTSSANKLSTLIEQIQSDAESIEKKLGKLDAEIDKQSENVRGEVRLLADALEKRVQNIEATISQWSDHVLIVKDDGIEERIAALKKSADLAKQQYFENSQYTVEILSVKKQDTLGNLLGSRYRKIGYGVEIYPSVFAERDFQERIHRNFDIELSASPGVITVLRNAESQEMSERIAGLIMLTINELSSVQVIELADIEPKTFVVIIGVDMSVNPYSQAQID